MLSEISQTDKEISYDIPYMQNLKRNDTNELIYKTETDSQLFRARTLNLEKELMVAGGRKGGKDS